MTVEVFIDSNRAWNLVRTYGTATQTSKSANNAVTFGTAYHVVAVFPNGSDHVLYVNGESVALTHTGAAVSGPLTIASNDEIAIGNATIGDRVGMAGDIGRVTMWPFAMSASRAKASYRQQNNLAQWVGISGENASSDTNKAPTAVPVQETLTAGAAKTIPVISRAYDPDGDALSIVPGSLAPSTGTASNVSDQIVWTPPASFTGLATCAFALRDGGGKSSQSRVYGLVKAPSSPTPGKYPPIYPVNKQRWIGGGGPAGSISHPAGDAGLAQALNAIGQGEEIVLEAGVTYGGNYDITRAGAEGAWNALRCRSHTGARLTGYIAGRAPWWWYSGLTLARPGAHPGNGNNQIYERPENYYSLILVGHHQKVTRCRVRSPNGLWVHHTANSASIIKETTATHHIDVLGNTFTGDATPIWNACASIYMGRFPENSAGPYNIDMAYNFFNEHTAPTNDAGGTDRWSNLYAGNSKPQDNPCGNVDTNLFRNNYLNTIYHGTYFKRGLIVRQNVYDMSRSGDQVINFRHGGRSNRAGDPPSGAFLNVPTVYIEANRFVRSGRGIQIGDTDHVVRDNIWQNGGGTIILFSGCYRNPALTSADPGYIQAAHRTILVNNAGVSTYKVGEFGASSTFILNTDEGGVISGVKIYKGSQTVTASNIQLLNGATSSAYQILDGDGGRSSGLTAPTEAEALAACGCDVP